MICAFNFSEIDEYRHTYWAHAGQALGTNKAKMQGELHKVGLCENSRTNEEAEIGNSRMKGMSRNRTIPIATGGTTIRRGPWQSMWVHGTRWLLLVVAKRHCDCLVPWVLRRGHCKVFGQVMLIGCCKCHWG